MQSSVASAALAVALLLSPVAAGYGPVLSQDFSITNQEAPATPGRRDLMRQLQAWWDVHAYYPRHASNSDEGGTVKVHLVIWPDGRIWSSNVVGSSGSASLDRAGAAAFSGGFVRPLPEGPQQVDLDVSLHYVLAHRHGEPLAAGYTPALSNSPFSITNDPVKSPILDTMLQRTCTGNVVKQGIRNHPAYGVRSEAEAIFFRKPDGTPWVKFYEGGYPILSPVTEIGNAVQWVGREEHSTRGGNKYGASSMFYQYTAWPDGKNNLSGSLITDAASEPDSVNRGGTVDLTCATDIVPAIGWSSWSVTPGQQPPGDPP